jgi:hypothetical protein
MNHLRRDTISAAAVGIAALGLAMALAVAAIKLSHRSDTDDTIHVLVLHERDCGPAPPETPDDQGTHL